MSPVSFPFAHDIGEFFIGDEAALDVAQDLVEGESLRRAAQSDAVLDDLDDVVRRTRRLELDSVEGAVHQVDARVNQTPADRTQNLLRRRRPLAPAAVHRFEQTLQTP